jgi:integrase
MKRYEKTFTFDGKRYHVYGKSEKEAIEKKAVLKSELENGKVIISKNTQVKTWIKEWIETYKAGDVNDRWLNDIKGICNNFIVPNIGHLPLKSVKPIHIKKILNSISNYSRSYNAKIYDILNQIFKTAVENNLLSSNPMIGIKKPQGVTPSKRRPITPYEHDITLKVSEYHRGSLFVLIMLYCGLRPQEVVPLTWKDINFKDCTLTINKALKSDGTVQPYTKTFAGMRKVPVPDILIKRLHAQKGSPFSLVCVNSYGNQYTASSYNAMWRNFKKEMNIVAGCKVDRFNRLIPPLRIEEDLTLYCYRHTYCTNLQAAGVPINVAKELMGHSDISVTSKIYTHKSETAFKNAQKNINDFVFLNSVSH